MIPVYPFQLPPQASRAVTGQSLTQLFYNWIRVLFLRTGGASGIPSTVAANLTATQQTLSEDYNEVLGAGGGGAFVVLANLQPGQSQVVFNGTGGALQVNANGSGLIDGAAFYSLPNGKSQVFQCVVTLANGFPSYRSTQLG